MIIISIGRNPDNKVVIHDPSNSVSVYHGEINVINNHSIIYKDFSTNGTLVNGSLLKNSQVTVQRGTLIVFPNNSQLDWNQIPIFSNLQNVKTEITIGKNASNNIKLHAEKASRYHAILKITNDGKYYLYDLSTNGTLVNGNEIQRFQDYQVKRSDKIFFANSQQLQKQALI